MIGLRRNDVNRLMKVRNDALTSLDIFSKFSEMFPQFHHKIKNWVTVNGSTIAVTLDNDQTLIFTYFNDKKWEVMSYG